MTSNNAIVTTSGSTTTPAWKNSYTGNDIYDFFDWVFKPLTNQDFSYSFSFPTNYLKIYDTSFPPVNVWVNEETRDLVMEFAVAGIPKDKINIHFENDRLYLEIDSHEHEREGYRLVQKGFKNSSSKTSYVIPFSKYDIKNAEASMEEGILRVTIPAFEDLRPRQLSIK